MKIISVIVPIYNGEKYIQDCVDGIINQTYEDLEILLINDGSTDNSMSICRLLAEQDHRIKVIEQANLGVSAARNNGMMHSKGEYIMFADCDDIVKPDYCEALIKNASNYDICVCGIEEFREDNSVKIMSTKFNSNMDGDVVKGAEELLKVDLLNSTCGKLYKKKLIKYNFNENMSMGEDIIFNLGYLERCKSILVIPESLYRYIRRNGSSCTKFKRNMGEMQKCIYETMYEFFSKDADFCQNYVDSKYFEHMSQLALKRTIQERTLSRSEKKKIIGEIISIPSFHKLVERYAAKSLKEKIWIFLIKTEIIKAIAV